MIFGPDFVLLVLCLFALGVMLLSASAFVVFLLIESFRRKP